MVINRNYKDSLFCKIFSEKKDLLELYNALNSSNYEDEEMLEITTLDDAIWMNYKNDISFIVSNKMNLYEHQSSVNPNMPIRGIRYFASLYNAYIDDNDLDIYGSKLVKLPTPEYVVFYNGDRKQPEKAVLNLSDAFEKVNETPALECRVTVLNINEGFNEEIKKISKKLSGYSMFVTKMKKSKKEGLNIEEAAKKTVNWCIENDILKGMLIKDKAEVLETVIFEYDEERHIRNEKAISFEEGIEYTAINMIKDGTFSNEQISKVTGLTMEKVDELRNSEIV